MKQEMMNKKTSLFLKMKKRTLKPEPLLHLEKLIKEDLVVSFVNLVVTVNQKLLLTNGSSFI
jgi:hypothetical protein